jgi:hypothetical protein
MGLQYYVVKMDCNGVIRNEHASASEERRAIEYAEELFRKENSISTSTKIKSEILFESSDPAETSAYILALEE